MKAIILSHKKKLIIISAVTLLDLLFGFDIKFTIINMVWLLV